MRVTSRPAHQSIQRATPGQPSLGSPTSAAVPGIESPPSPAIHDRVAAGYNLFVDASIFDELKSYVGFSSDDAARLNGLADRIDPYLPAVVERFYAEIVRHPSARRIMVGGEQQMQRLRTHFLHWLRSLFAGDHSLQYFREHESIGSVHVHVGLPQHYMPAAMEVVWQELQTQFRRSGIPESDEALASLHKLMTLETAMMLESYKLRYTDQVREVERNALRERLSRAEHLAEIGQLSASLAHEIKNPLAGISGAIQVIRDSMPEANPHRPILEEVIRQVSRLDRTVKDLLDYARPTKPQIRACDLREILQRVSGLLGREPAFQRVRFEAACDGVPPIEADDQQIAQLLMNLLLNAAHASPPGARIRIRAARSGDAIDIQVEDEGHGMDEEVCRRAFEPFFTTKARGTGLGLSICQRIVESQNGSIGIESRPNQGTTVSVRLPICRSPNRPRGEEARR